jgi:hypothetical protein
MKRGHRKAHLFVWLLLAPIALIGLAIGIASRSEMPAQDPPVVQDLPQANPPATEVVAQ